LAPNLIGLAVARWRGGDEDGARDAVARLMEEEPEFHLSDILPLPYRAEADWPRFLETLRCADAVD
jgi:hypothetical protein